MEYVYDDWCGWVGKQLAQFLTSIAQGIQQVFSLDHTIFHKYLDDSKNGFFTTRVESVIQIVAISLCVLLFALALFKNLFASVTEEYESPLALTARFAGAITFCILSKPILNLFYNIYKQIYNLILGSVDYDFLSIGVNETNVHNMTAIFGGLIALILRIVLIIEFIKLVLELAERYLVVEFGFLLSPLAGAMLTSKSTHKVFVSFMKIMASSFLLIALNALFVRATLAAMNSYSAQSTNPDGAHFLWVIFLVALMRTGCAIDKYLNNMGLSIAQTGGNLVGEMLGAARDGMLIAGSIPKAMKTGFGMAGKADKVAGAAFNAAKNGTGVKGFMANMAGGATDGLVRSVGKNFAENGAANKGAKILAGLGREGRGEKAFSSGTIKGMADALFKPGTSFGGAQASPGEKAAAERGMRAVLGGALEKMGIQPDSLRASDGRVYGTTPGGGKFSIGNKKLADTDRELIDATGAVRFLHKEGDKPLNLAATNKMDAAMAQGATSTKTQTSGSQPLGGIQTGKAGSVEGGAGSSTARFNRNGADTTTKLGGSANSVPLPKTFTDDGATAYATANAIDKHNGTKYVERGDFSGISTTATDTSIELSAGDGGSSLGKLAYDKINGGEPIDTPAGDTLWYVPHNDSKGASKMFEDTVSHYSSAGSSSVISHTTPDGFTEVALSGEAARSFASQMVDSDWSIQKSSNMNSLNMNTTTINNTPEFRDLEQYTGPIARVTMNASGCSHVTNVYGEKFIIDPLDKISPEAASKGKVLSYTGGKGIIRKEK